MKIQQLFIHPIKSSAAIAVDSLHYEQIGPRFDRNWMVVDEHGNALTQRTLPNMCFIQAQPVQNGLQLNAPNLDQITVGEPTGKLKVTVWDDTVWAGDCGDEAAAWLSDFLQRTCRLVKLASYTNRRVDPKYAQAVDTVGFADGFPTLVVSQASLDEFNTQLDSDIDMRRFRPNIVVGGCEPFAEDQWQSIRIGDIRFNLVKPCSRCIMPSINPDTGVKEMQVNQALLETRRRQGKTYFGQNATHVGTGLISVGDPVEVLD